MPAHPKKPMLCYKCNEDVKNHLKCNGCSILRHAKDAKCSCKLSAREFADIMHANAKKGIITLS